MKFNTSKLLRSALPLSVALLLAACGGGGGGTAGPSGGGYTYTVSGTVSGLSGTVILQNNGGDDLSISVSNSKNFAFAKPINSGNAYNVTVLTQPSNQRCLVANGTGSATANVSNVSVSCASQMGGAMQGVSLNLAPTVSTLAGTAFGNDGAGPTATFSDPYGVTSDGTNLYVADSKNNKIRKIVISSGAVTTLAGTGAAGAADGAGSVATFNYPQGITIDVTKTNLYVVDQFNNKIRKIVIATGDVSSFTGVPNATVAAGATDGTGTAATFNVPTDITSDGTDLYVTDSGNNKIRKIVTATGVVSSFTGVASTAGAGGAVDGAGTAATFSYPFSITADSANLYVTDYGNQKIRKIVIATGVVSSFTGVASTVGVTGALDSAGATATFNWLRGITTDGTNLYVTDSGNNKIRMIVIATGVVSSVTGVANTAGVAGTADGAGAAATFNWPQGITATAGGMLYVADGRGMIRRVVRSTAEVGTLAGSAYGVDGTGATASFSGPHSVTSDGVNLYVADSANNKIRKIVIATGVVTTLAGTGVAGAADGAGAAAMFDAPYGITTDGTNLYVADDNNNKIRKIVIATGVVSSVTGVANTAGATGAADGPGATATFYYPHGITTDGTNLYVADSYNNKIRKIVIATGVVSSLTGLANTAVVAGSADGAATAATLDFPWGITTDGTNLYVADWGNDYKIRQIEIATGKVGTLAGAVYTPGVPGVNTAVDGPGAAATFSEPQGITCDGTNLYVVDQSNNKIRKIVIATGVVSSLTGVTNTTGVAGAADGAGAVATFNFPHAITTDGSSLYVADDHTIRKIQ
jgi:sugar lactone lactonase YvrE